MSIVAAPRERALPFSRGKNHVREIAVFVACSTACFGRYPLDQALRTIGELNFHKLDVALSEAGPHLRPSELAADINHAAQRIRLSPSLAPAAFTIEIAAPDGAEYQRQLRAVCHLARLCNVAVVTIPAAAAGTAITEESERLRDLCRIADQEGIILSAGTRIGTLTEEPDAAVALCRTVPGLGLTLDPSHFIAGPNQGKSFDHVYPFVQHVQLRDTGRGVGQFQVRVGQGEVEYGRIIGQLARHHYNRILTVAINDQPEAPYDMEQEVRKLKYLLESLV
jgi:sugar phosphate isomerase/epimerase